MVVQRFRSEFISELKIPAMGNRQGFWGGFERQRIMILHLLMARIDDRPAATQGRPFVAVLPFHRRQKGFSAGVVVVFFVRRIWPASQENSPPIAVLALNKIRMTSGSNGI